LVWQNDVCSVILAAGSGRRICSEKPKIFREVLFKPLVNLVFENCKKAKIKEICFVCAGDGLGVLKGYFKEEASYVIQEEKLGTAHATAQAVPFLKASGKKDVLVLLADVPFIDAQTIEDAYFVHKKRENDVTVIAATLQNPFGYGRIEYANDRIKIVEEKDATDTQRAIKQVNSGALWFNVSALLAILERVDNKNASGEYYITTAVNLLTKTGCYLAEDANIILGANTNEQLLTLNEVAKDRVISYHSCNGVEFLSKDGVMIGADVKIGKGTQIFPGVTIKGSCQIGEDCVVTSGTFIEDSNIGDNCQIKSSYIESSVIACGVSVGPFAHIRAGCEIEDGVKVGNYVEVKNSYIGAKTKIAHHNYVGDCSVGFGVNLGCGVVVANYDGEEKHKSKIEDDVFIGCNSNLIAPVTIRRGAFVAAGSTITENIEENGFAIARARQETKPNYKRKRKGQ
jgi:bifunctional UDP-N-acetylglucosamine pyrophosphorylase/glucosamine-1-phosphate N-acetyltransferase